MIHNYPNNDYVAAILGFKLQSYLELMQTKQKEGTLTLEDVPRSLLKLTATLLRYEIIDVESIWAYLTLNYKDDESDEIS